MKTSVLSLFLLVGLAVPACVTAAPDTGNGQEPWPLAVRLMSYGKYEDAAFDHLQSIGVHYLFMAVPAADQVDATMARLKEHGLTPLVLRGNTDLAQETCVDELEAQLAVCEKMGVAYMFLSAKRNGALYEAVYARLRRVGDNAARHGVTVTLETHPDLGTNGDVQIETMRAINHQNIRVNFDTANITYYNHDTTALAELQKSIEFVHTVELKDHSGAFETWEFPVLGKGVVDFPGILKALGDHGYAGPVTIEFEGIKGVELSQEQTLEAIADSVAYARSIGSFK